jgi:hypothetical protein
MSESSNELFLYTGQSRDEIPRNVTHAKVVHPAVKVIGGSAFWGCRQLRSVELYEGLERIDKGAFQLCTSLERITIPSTVKVIGWQAFISCSKLRSVELSEGLEEIDGETFRSCTSLTSIAIPSTVKVIGEYAFYDCGQLRDVEL